MCVVREWKLEKIEGDAGDSGDGLCQAEEVTSTKDRNERP